MVKECLLELGYKNNEIEKIVNEHALVNLKENTLKLNILKNYKFLLRLGISQDRIIQLTTLHPQIYAHTIEYMEKKINILVELGYSQTQTVRIIKKFPQIIGLDIKNIMSTLKYISSLGFNTKEVTIITTNVPQLFGYDHKTIDKKIAEIEFLGYKKEEVIQIIKKYPNILTFDINTVKQNIKKMTNIWKDSNRVLSMIKKMPQIVALDTDKFNDKIDDITSLGYKNREQVMKMIGGYPQLLGYSFGAIKERINAITLLGFSYEAVLHMTSSFSPLFGLDIESIKAKKDLYEAIGIGEIFIKDTKQLMQGIKLSYARYMFYKSIGIDINMSNYILLFIDQKRFKSRFKEYGIDNEKVVLMYPYDIENVKKLIKE